MVLGLRAYLLGEMSRFVVPSEGGSLTGRPPKLSFGVPGARTALRKKAASPPQGIGRAKAGIDAAF